MTLATRPETIRGTCRACGVDTYLHVTSRTQGSGTKVRCADCGHTWSHRPGAAQPRPQLRYQITADHIDAYHTGRMSARQIATEVGFSPTTVRARLADAGVLREWGAGTHSDHMAQIRQAYRDSRSAKSRRDYLLAVELRTQGLTWREVATVLGFAHWQSAANLVRRHRTKENPS